MNPEETPKNIENIVIKFGLLLSLKKNLAVRNASGLFTNWFTTSSVSLGLRELLYSFKSFDHPAKDLLNSAIALTPFNYYHLLERYTIKNN
jgi:hypothetical protein